MIDRLADGDDAALRDLFNRHAPMLATRLRALLPVVDVEDVLQETFIAAWRGARRYRPDGAVGAWLWGIVRRQAALLLRRRGPTGVPLHLLEATSAVTSDPAEAAVSRADLARAVAGLGPPGSPERDVWQLLYLEQHSVAEIAVLQGVPEGAVKSRAYRTRRLLRVVLGRHLAMTGGS